MRRKSDAFIFGKNVRNKPAGEGMTRQLLGYDDSLMVVRVAFDEGAVGYVHSHHHAQASYVESGEFDVLIDGVEKRLGPGVLLDIFSPMRDDFLGESDNED